MIPRQSAVWDESRNTSRARPPSPNALRDALTSMESFRRNEPAHAQWIADGYPTLTEAEHVARFGVEYDATKRKRP